MSVKLVCDECGRVIDRMPYWKLDAVLFDEVEGEAAVARHAPYHFCSLIHLMLWTEKETKDGDDSEQGVR